MTNVRRAFAWHVLSTTVRWEDQWTKDLGPLLSCLAFYPPLASPLWPSIKHGYKCPTERDPRLSIYYIIYAGRGFLSSDPSQVQTSLMKGAGTSARLSLSPSLCLFSSLSSLMFFPRLLRRSLLSSFLFLSRPPSRSTAPYALFRIYNARSRPWRANWRTAGS